jgi:hypothetical protein
MMYMEVTSDSETIISGNFHCGENHDDVRSVAYEADATGWFVEASGDELEAVRRYITGVRMVPGRVVQWTGDDALFIIMNIDLTKINASDMKRMR